MSLQVFDAADETLLATAAMDVELQLAQKPQRENIIRQLTKLGNTPYVCEELTIVGDADKYFIPSSQLAELRRKTQTPASPGIYPSPSPVERVAFEGSGGQPHLLNVSNRLAREFYREQGIEATDALEISPLRNGGSGLLLMQCRHCLRFTLGYCVKHGGRKPAWREPLFLRLGDGREFRLEFDCRACQMNIYSK